jgi:hypothetical protein
VWAMVKNIFGKKAMSLPVIAVLIVIALTLVLIIGILLSNGSTIFKSP